MRTVACSTTPPLCALVVACVGLFACGGPPAPVVPAPGNVNADTTVIGTRAEGTPKELLEKAEHALLGQRWQEAIDALEAVVAAEPNGVFVPRALSDLGLAYENLGLRDKARAKYREVLARFPTSIEARPALLREATLDAYLEDWKALGDAAERILAQKDIDPHDRAFGLGARALSKVNLGDDNGASKDVQDGLDIAEELHLGAGGRLPVAAAQLRYGLGEVRRVRSERVALLPVTADFLVKIEIRCQGLLDAQSSYADAIRSVDPHWAMMSGFKVGEMYRTLHKDLMAIPPTALAKSEKDKQLFYAIMHVRYRTLLDKGVEMMRRTIGLAEKSPDAVEWTKRAEAAKKEMEDALVEEKAQLAKMPFTEAEIEKTLKLMKQHLEEKREKAERQKAGK